jgi:hypothetical protein
MHPAVDRLSMGDAGSTASRRITLRGKQVRLRLPPKAARAGRSAKIAAASNQSIARSARLGQGCGACQRAARAEGASRHDRGWRLAVTAVRVSIRLDGEGKGEEFRRTS